MPTSYSSWGNITLLDFVLSRVVLIKDIPIATRVVRNWYDLLLFRLRLKKKIVIVLKSGKRFPIKNDEEYYSFVNDNTEWALEWARQLKPMITVGKKKITVKAFGQTLFFHYDSRFSLGNSIDLIIQQFDKQGYEILNVEGKNVVDIGASIGDTAIYFAAKGANHVYALEPFKKIFDAAKKNVALNHLNNKITLLNMAVGRKSGFIMIDEDVGVDRNAFVEDEVIGGKKKTRIATLDDIVRICKIKNGVLKIDCEGCEYAALLGASDKALRHFDRMMVEYHYGYINLERKLKVAGFKVKHTTPRFGGYYIHRDPPRYDGYIFATRE